MRQLNVTIQILILIASLLIAVLLIGGKLNSQTNKQVDKQLLQEAIKLIRNFVGDQSLKPLFGGEDKEVWFFEGPCRVFEFGWIPGYRSIEVRVSPLPVSIVYWSKTDDTWLPYVNTNLPEKNDDELLTIAQNYASKNFPGWEDFPHWQGIIYGKFKHSGYGKTVRSRLICFYPYFVNDRGDKIIFAPAGCSIRVEPHEGRVLSFSWHYNLKMTLSNDQLIPTISPSEAKAISERKIREWVMQRVTEEIKEAEREGHPIPKDVILKGMEKIKKIEIEAMLCDPEEPYQKWWGNLRLIIGATATSGLRLAYLIDIRVKDPETDEVRKWKGLLIDAHTGQILRYPDVCHF
jgi:hypothetical protein